MINRSAGSRGATPRFAPAWIEEAREIEAERRRLDARRDTVSQDFVERVAALNRRILSYNLKVPAAILRKVPFDPM